MTYRDARDLAIEFGARLPDFDHTHPLASGWVDRIAWLPSASARGQLQEAIDEANRYAGLL